MTRPLSNGLRELIVVAGNRGKLPVGGGAFRGFGVVGGEVGAALPGHRLGRALKDGRSPQVAAGAAPRLRQASGRSVS